MADAYVQLPSDASNTGKKVDTSELTVGANTVERQRYNLADPAAATSIQAVKAASTPAALTDCAAVVAVSPNSPVGHAKFRDLAATVQAVKAAAGTLYGLQLLNNQGAAAYVQVFDKAAGGVVLATDTPDLEVLVPANSQVNVPLPALGIAFATAIAIASTTAEKGAVGSAAGVMAFVQYA